MTVQIQSISFSTNSDNLSKNDLVYDDPGLFIFEMGYFRAYKMIPLETKFVLGAAKDSDSFLGLEFDVHNSLQVNKDLEFEFSGGYLTMREDRAPSTYKMDCSLTYSF